MITHISISNFAIIKNTEIDFEKGLSIVTGETGSGKSIVIEAISLALGARADSSLIRHGEKKAEIVLVTSLGDEDFVIKREISQNGKNICRINGEVVSLSQVLTLGRRLADLHGQYDNQVLLNEENHIDLLDQYGGEVIKSLKADYLKSYHEYLDLKNQLSRLDREERELRRKADFYAFELKEIEDANLKLGEDEILEDEISLLENSEVIFDAIEDSYYQLFAKEGSAIESLSKACHKLEGASEFSSQIAEAAQSLSDLTYSLEAIQDSLRSIKNSLTFDPKQLDRNINRLEKINGLKKKYGNSIEEILAYQGDIKEKINLLENYDFNASEIEKKLNKSEALALESAKKLSNARKDFAKKLSQAITKELRELNFSHANLKITVDNMGELTDLGMDQVAIYISTNKGEPLKPLVKTASGGEISRIMLAIKKITGSFGDIPTMIFDEIDTGISGITASIIGRKLQEISRSHQIICITHLPQIAAMSDASYRIYKETDENSTYTHVDELTEDEKVLEVARLLGGEKLSPSAIENAKELISQGRSTLS